MPDESITSSTSTEDIYEIYVANQNYDLDRDVSACRNFIRAARALHAQIVKGKASFVTIDGNQVTFDSKMIERQIAAAIEFWRINDTSAASSGAGAAGAVVGRAAGSRVYDMREIRE